MASSYHLSYSHCVVALHLIDGMCPPVDGDCIALFKGAVELITKELKSLLLGDALVKLELGAHVLEVGLRLQLRHPRREHHGQQADQQAAVVSQDKIGCFAEFPELLELVLTSAMFSNDLARGLNEACKALEYDHDSEDRKAALCVLASNCSEDNYKKLITGLCKSWKVRLMTVDDRVELGKMAGLAKYDNSGVARKTRPCSCVVIRNWPKSDDLKASVQLLQNHTA